MEVELPHTSHFCYWEDGALSHLKFMVELRANAARGVSGSELFPIFMAVKDAIQYMGIRVEQLVVCCSSAARQSCECGWSLEDIKKFTDDRNFYDIDAEVIPNRVVNTECVCFDNPQISFNESKSSNYEVVSMVTFDSIKFYENKIVAVSDLFEILEEMGKLYEELYEGQFFAAITDQYAFCAEEPTNLSLRMQGVEYTINDFDRMMFDGEKNMAIWLNVTHHENHATVSIKGGGNISLSWKDVWDKIYNCYQATEGLTSFTSCALNKILFSGQIILTPADDFVIKGKDNSSVSVVNDVLKLSVQTNLDFGGQHIQADLSNQVIGIQRSYGGAASAFVKAAASYDVVSVLFFSGDYAGYWYDYDGASVIIGGNIGSPTASVGYGRSMVYGWTDISDYYTPKGFEGPFMGGNGNFDIGIGVTSIGVSGSYTKSYVKNPTEEDPDQGWTVLQLGFDVNAGLETLGGSLGVGFEAGRTYKRTTMMPTQERSSFNIIANWVHGLISFIHL